jgi:hypothetical protein
MGRNTPIYNKEYYKSKENFTYLHSNMTFTLDNIVARAKRRGFAYPGSDIYG